MQINPKELDEVVQAEQRPAGPTPNGPIALAQQDAEYAAVSAELDRNPNPTAQMSAIGPWLLSEFGRAKADKLSHEQRFLKDLRQYKGIYEPEEETKMAGRSKAYVRKTRVKVKTVDSRVADLLFPAGTERNYDMGPTPKPQVDPRRKAEITAALQQRALDMFQAQAAAAQQAGQPGPAKPTPVTEADIEAATLEEAKKAAKEMAKTIDDQLTECRYKEACLRAIHSAHLFGTGIIKGPLVERKVRTQFRPVRTSRGVQWVAQPQHYVVPFVESVPIWRWYPDMSATELKNCRYVWERHLMNSNRLLELASRPSFKKASEIIKDFVAAHPNGLRSTLAYDQELRALGELESTQTNDDGNYEVLERWGYLRGDQLKEAGIDVPAGRDHESFFCNVWMLSNGEVIKAAMQPIDGSTWPYHLYYFDKDETSIFAEGLSVIMRDDQTMLNASVRMMLDNAALTAGPQIEVAIELLGKLEKHDELVPFKVWKRTDINAATLAYPAVRVIDIPNNVDQMVKLASMFEANADETTAIPRYMSGENATSGAAGTAAGMSMLMAAANIVIKDLIAAWDEGVTRPFITALYHWNMQFNKNQAIKGDFDVKARGTASLVAREVRARQLNDFATLASDPQDAPFIKRHRLLVQRAEALELSDVVKTEEEVKADNESDQAKKNAEMQQQIAEAQVREAIARAAHMEGQAELAMRRAAEIETTMKAKLDNLMADTAKIVAQMVETKVSTIYAALQAGGTATMNPQTAPAGDEILQSSGFEDVNGSPSIAQLNGPPVQIDQGTAQLMQRGQTFAQQPRGPQPVQAAPAMLPPQTGMVGERAGIETVGIEA